MSEVETHVRMSDMCVCVFVCLTCVCVFVCLTLKSIHMSDVMYCVCTYMSDIERTQ